MTSLEGGFLLLWVSSYLLRVGILFVDEEVLGYGRSG